jgi:hypothetical protein
MPIWWVHLGTHYYSVHSTSVLVQAMHQVIGDYGSVDLRRILGYHTRVLSRRSPQHNKLLHLNVMYNTKHFDVIEHRCPGQHIRQYPRGTSESEEDELHLAVKQYVPRVKEPGNHGGSQGITLVACHANAAPKELYEPMWDALYEYMQKSGKAHILSIWIADVANQGQSSVLNEKKLGNERENIFDRSTDTG